MTITETPLKGARHARHNGSPCASSATARDSHFPNFPSYKAYFPQRTPSSAGRVDDFDSAFAYDLPPLFPDARLHRGVV